MLEISASVGAIVTVGSCFLVYGYFCEGRETRKAEAQWLLFLLCLDSAVRVRTQRRKAEKREREGGGVG